MASVTINGNTYTDDADPTTGLANGGHRRLFIPLVADVVVYGGQVVSDTAAALAAAQAQAAAAAASAASAVLSPTTNGTSTTSLTIGTGAQTLTTQTGKNFVVGMSVKIARTAAPTNWMAGDVTAYDGATGALTVDIIATNGSGTFTDWTISLSGPVYGAVAAHTHDAADVITGTLALARGGTGSGTASGARTNLGVVDAAAADWHAATAGRYLLAAQLYTAAAPIALSDAATITPDFAAGRSFGVTLAGNRTLANPTNQAAGQSGMVIVRQDGNGSRTLAYGTHWKFAGGAPTLSTAPNAIDVIAYYVEASGTILATFSRGFA